MRISVNIYIQEEANKEENKDISKYKFSSRGNEDIQ